MPEGIPTERAVNLNYYRNAAALAAFSFYRLLDEEEELFAKYYVKGQSVLDLACGMARTTLLLHELGMNVRGIDQSRLFIETARKRFPYLDLHEGSFDSLDEADSSYDHILLALNSIDYAFPVSQREAALRECARILKPGGTLIYSSHNIKSLHLCSPHYWNQIRWKLRNCADAFHDSRYILEAGQHTLYTSQQFVKKQTETVGLQFVELRGFKKIGVQTLDQYFSPYLHYVFRKLPKTSNG